MTKTCCDIRYKLIATDLIIQGMDGYIFAKEIHKMQIEFKRVDKDYYFVPIIGLGVIVNEETAKKCE